MRARIWNKSTWISDTDPDTLKRVYGDKLVSAGFKVLDFTEHFFTPQGYTALWLLGESHFAVHTFPEEDKTYIELSSCNKAYFDRFWQCSAT